MQYKLSELYHAAIISKLAAKNQRLLGHAIKFGLPGMAAMLKQTDQELFCLLCDLAQKANFNPSQPRVPAGEPNGGQWAGDDIYDPPIEAVYPVESAILFFMPTGRLLNAWRLWNSARNNWQLGNFKSPTKWANQLLSRDWTPRQITDTIKKGKKFPAPNKVNKLNSATRYEYNGRFIVRDNVTKEILQISGKNFVAN